MASLDTGSVTAALKQIYPTGVPKEMIYKNSPFLASIKKDTNKLRSQGIVIPLHYTGPQGISANFANARTYQTSSEYAKITLTHKNYYGTAQIDGEVIDMAKGDPGAFIDALKTETDRAIYGVKRSLSRHIFGNGGGALGRVATFSTTTATLSNPSDVRFFEVGQELAFDDTDGSSGGAVRAGTATVTGVNRATGALTSDSDWDAQITSPTALDYAFRVGDFGATLAGVEAWLPRTASGALITAFYGLDRSPDSRLYGQRGDLSSYTPEEQLVVGAEQLARENGTVDFAVVNTVNYRNLVLALGSKVVYDTMESYDAKIGFKVVKVAGPTGDIAVMPDADMPVDRLFMGQLDTWTLYSMGDLVKLLDNDGNAVLRTGTTDAVELQLVSRSNLGCIAPGFNANFQIG